MFRPWTARIILTCLTIQVGMLCSLYTQDLSFLRRSEEGIFKTVLSWVRNLNPEEVILDSSPEGGSWQLRPLIPANDPELDFSVIELPRTKELFDGERPSPAEYAVLLSKIHQAGAREIAFTSELSWEDAPEIELVALDSALGAFEQVFLPVAVSEVPSPAGDPGWLENSLLPAECLQGDLSRLPLVNVVLSPPSVSAPEVALFSFPDFGNRDLQFRSDNRLPLVARWGDSFLPSWALRLAMEQAGTSPAEVTFEPGETFRFGKAGPVVAIDDYGRAKIEETVDLTAEQSNRLSAKMLFPLSEGDLPELKRRVIFLDQVDEASRQRSERLLAESTSLLSFPRPGRAEVFRRLSFGWEMLLYLEIALVGIFALHVRSASQLIALALLCGGLFILVVGLLDWKGLWTPILPLLAAITMSWCLIGYLQQVAHPVKKKPRKNLPETQPTPEASATS